MADFVALVKDLRPDQVNSKPYVVRCGELFQLLDNKKRKAFDAAEFKPLKPTDKDRPKYARVIGDQVVRHAVIAVAATEEELLKAGKRGRGYGVPKRYSRGLEMQPLSNYDLLQNDEIPEKPNRKDKRKQKLVAFAEDHTVFPVPGDDNAESSELQDDPKKSKKTQKDKNAKSLHEPLQGKDEKKSKKRKDKDVEIEVHLDVEEVECEEMSHKPEENHDVMVSANDTVKTDMGFHGFEAPERSDQILTIPPERRRSSRIAGESLVADFSKERDELEKQFDLAFVKLDKLNCAKEALEQRNKDLQKLNENLIDMNSILTNTVNSLVKEVKTALDKVIAVVAQSSDCECEKTSKRSSTVSSGESDTETQLTKKRKQC